jgi:hypothetical protein
MLQAIDHFVLGWIQGKELDTPDTLALDMNSGTKMGPRSQLFSVHWAVSGPQALRQAARGAPQTANQQRAASDSPREADVGNVSGHAQHAHPGLPLWRLGRLWAKRPLCFFS